VNVQKANWVPSSPSMMPLGAGFEESVVLPSALVARSAHWVESMAQSDTRRDQTPKSAQ
jgi:hypothetical protein